MSNVVKWLHSGMVGAPVVGNSFGDMIAMLDACLVNGFNSKAVTAITRVGNVATATVGAAHGFIVEQMALLAGADQAEYNGEFRITAIGSTTISFAVTGTPATPATGAAITCKVAPLGWTKPFAATNRAAYRSSNAASTKPYLYVNNAQSSTWTATHGIDCWVEMCESMVDIDTAVNRVPRDASVSRTDGWFHWYQARGSGTKLTATNQGTYSKTWVLVGDDRTFYLLSNPYTSYGRQLWGFGDFISYRPADPWPCFLSASENYDDASNFSYPFGNTGLMHTNNYTMGNTSMGCAVQRPFHGLQGWSTFTVWGLAGPNVNNGNLQSGYGYSVTYPNPTDNSLILAPRYICENSNTFRGQLPGLYATPCTSTMTDLSVVDNVTGYAGRKFLCVAADAQSFTSVATSNGAIGNGARYFFDIYGPWQ